MFQYPKIAALILPGSYLRVRVFVAWLSRIAVKACFSDNIISFVGVIFKYCCPEKEPEI
jgi:hypothetical protein